MPVYTCTYIKAYVDKAYIPLHSLTYVRHAYIRKAHRLTSFVVVGRYKGMRIRVTFPPPIGVCTPPSSSTCVWHKGGACVWHTGVPACGTSGCLGVAHAHEGF